MSKKKLNQLFQEKFSHFSKLPDQEVWERIDASLDKKKKNRKLIPLWWRLGGIAAALAILLYAVNPFKGIVNTHPIVTEIEKNQAIDSLEKKIKNPTLNNDQKEIENTVIVSESEDTKLKNNEPQDVLKENSSLVTNNSKKNQPTSNNHNPAVAKVVLKNNSTKQGVLPSEHPTNGLVNQKDAAAVVLEENQQALPKGTSYAIKNDIISSDKYPSSTPLIENKIQNGTKNNSAVATHIPQNSINDIGVEKGNAQIGKDSLSTVVDNTNKKSILDVIEDQKEAALLVDQPVTNKWSVGANVAPVYFNSFGEGSPVNSSFSANSKSGDVNLSYGLSVAYKLNKKLSVRSGIHKVDYGYNTNDVAFTSSFAISGDQQIANISYTSPAANVLVESAPVSFSDKQIAGDALNESSVREGALNQQFGYLEVPVELSYTLLNSKFGINLVGGVSSLFLVDNSISINSGDLTTKIGEANNINSVNFSGNLGFGINYKFTPKLHLNIEPIFKYQLNTFSNVSGDFQPFSVGVFSGFSFKF